MSYVLTDSGNVIAHSASIKGASRIVLPGHGLIEENATLAGDSKDVDSSIVLGKYCVMDKSCTLSPPLRKDRTYPLQVGSFVYFGPRSWVNAASIGSFVIVGADAVIEKFAMIGDCVVLMPGVRLPAFSVVPPLSLVNGPSDIQPLSESARKVIERFCRERVAGIDALPPFGAYQKASISRVLPGIAQIDTT